jgi:hypothetical protein
MLLSVQLASFKWGIVFLNHMTQEKKCSKCGAIKSIEEFYFRKDNNKYRSECKKCWCFGTKKYKNINYQKTKLYKINWANQHRDKMMASRKKWEEKNPEKSKEIKKKWERENWLRIKERKRLYYINYPEKRWEKKYPEKARICRNNWYNNKYHTDINFKMTKIIRSLVRISLKKRLIYKNNKSTNSILNSIEPNYIDKLKQHLEKQFKPWMNWSNWVIGDGKWSVDHKKADSLFDYKSIEDEEFKKCWAISNLQPMDWMENIKKSNKII